MEAMNDRMQRMEAMVMSLTDIIHEKLLPAMGESGLETGKLLAAGIVVVKNIFSPYFCVPFFHAGRQEREGETPPPATANAAAATCPPMGVNKMLRPSPRLPVFGKDMPTTFSALLSLWRDRGLEDFWNADKRAWPHWMRLGYPKRLYLHDRVT